MVIRLEHVLHKKKINREVINPLDFLKILKEKFGDEIILLCHELPSKELNVEHFGHRRLVADWIELKTGIVIPEISINGEGSEVIEEVYNLKPKIKTSIKN